MRNIRGNLNIIITYKAKKITQTRSRIPLFLVQYAMFFPYVSMSKIKCNWYHAKPNFISYTLVYCKVSGV